MAFESAEVDLWQSVLARMILDLLSDAESARRAREQAEDWIGRYPTQAFREVCLMAGEDADRAHAKLRAVVAVPVCQRQAYLRAAMESFGAKSAQRVL